MNKVCMVEYQGRCDDKGKAVGHAPKVLREYLQFIRNGCEVSLFAPKVILKELPEEEWKKTDNLRAKVLPRHIVMKGRTPFWEKIANKLHMFQNIRSAIKHADADILWFFNVEYYLMLYLFLHKKPKQKLVCTLFLDGYHADTGLKAKAAAGVKQWVFEQAQKKISLIISTGKQFTFRNCRWEYIPDYYDQRELYGPYRRRTASGAGKEERAVCLGTMGNGKQLEEMVSAFARIGYPLTVAGRFYDKERVNALRMIAEQGRGTIEILDRYLAPEEYLSLLSGAKYTVLPYPPQNYATQTSGVMQEAVFVDTVPVTYRAILEGNGVSGVGFESWEELSRDMLLRDVTDCLSEYRRLRETEYSEALVKKRYTDIFCDLWNGKDGQRKRDTESDDK